MFTPNDRPDEEQPEKQKTMQIDDAILASYIGQYVTHGKQQFQIAMKDRHLQMNSMSEPFVLEPLSHSSFSIKGKSSELNFLKTLDEFPIRLEITTPGQGKTRATKLQPFDSKKGIPKEFEGSYYSEELGTTYNFVRTGKQLIVKHQKNTDLELMQIGPNTFTGNWGELVFQRNRNGEIAGFRLAGYGVIGIIFRKVVPVSG